MKARPSIIHLLPAMLVSLVLSASALAQQAYHVTELPKLSSGTISFSAPDYISSSASGINDLGEVVAGNLFFSGMDVTLLPFVYPPPPYEPYSQRAWAVNNNGVVAGHGGARFFPNSTVERSQRGFVYDSSTSSMTNVGVLTDGAESRLFAINDSGTAAGWSYKLISSAQRQQAVTFAGGVLVNRHESVRLNPTDTQSAIFAIEDSGDLAGFSMATSGQVTAFRYNSTNSTTSNLGSFSETGNSVALGMNGTATVGWSQIENGNRNAFFHDGNTLNTLEGTFDPGLQSSAADINSEDDVIVTGPGTPTSLFALTVATDEEATATLTLQEGSPLSVMADTELRGGAVINATQSMLQTSYLHGNGTVLGDLDAGFIYTRGTDVLSLLGIVNADTVSVLGTSVLQTSGTLHGTIGQSGVLQGTIKLLGDTAFGGEDIIPSIRVGSLDVGEHTATLLTSGSDAHEIRSVNLAGGEIIADTSLKMSNGFVFGPGTVSGNLEIGSTVVQPGAGQSLLIDGNLQGTGLLVGPNITVTGLTTPSTWRFNDELPSVDIGTEDAVLFGNGRAMVRGLIDMSGGTVTASNGVTIVSLLSMPPGGFRGFGVIDGAVGGSGDVIATGNLTLGDQDSTSGVDLGFSSGGRLDASSHTVTLLDADEARIGFVSLAGGTVVAENGLAARTISGEGVINGAVSSIPFFSFSPQITATGDLTIGDDESSNGVAFFGNLAAGNHRVTLRDADLAIVSSVAISGGTIVAKNGLFFGSLLASGIEATSTIQGNVNLANSVLEATASNTLDVTGTISGFGVLLGDVMAQALNATSGAVQVSNLAIGSRSMTFLSESSALLGGTNTIASVGASDGISLLGTLSGYGAINPGLGQPLLLENGILDAQQDQVLAVSGDLGGYGVVVGNVTVTGSNTLASGPSDQVILYRNLDVGSRNATFYTTDTAAVRSEVGIAGGTLFSSTGEWANEGGKISGHGSIAGNMQLVSGLLDADSNKQTNLCFRHIRRPRHRCR